MSIGVVHGTADPYLSYNGGYGPQAAALPTPDGKGTLGDTGIADPQDAAPVPERVAAWAGRNGCTGQQATSDRTADEVHGGSGTYPGGVHRIRELGDGAEPGDDEPGIHLRPGHEHEGPFVRTGVRHRQLVGAQHHMAEGEDVDVERTRGVAHRPYALLLHLQSLRQREELGGGK